MSLPVPAEPLLPALGRSPSTAEELLREFYASRSPNTLAAYRQDVKAFALWARGAGDELDEAAAHALSGRVMAELMKGGKGAATATLVRWRNEQLARGLASSTVKRRLTTLRTLLAFAHSVEMISWDVRVKNPRPEAARDMSGPTRDEAVAIVQRAKSRVATPKGARNAALVSLLYDHALRVSEALGLDLEHLALDDGAPRILILGKGRRHRERVSLAPQAVASLRAWLAHRGLEPGPLFAGRGGRLHDRSARRAVAKLARDAGVARLVRPHGLRHSAATHLWRTTKDLLLVKEFLRHRSIATTQRYLDIHAEDYGLQAATLLAVA